MTSGCESLVDMMPAATVTSLACWCAAYPAHQLALPVQPSACQPRTGPLLCLAPIASCWPYLAGLLPPLNHSPCTPMQVKVLNDPATGKPVVVSYTGLVLYASSCMDSTDTMQLGFLTATYDVAAGSWGMRLYTGGGGSGLAEITPDVAGEVASLAGRQMRWCCRCGPQSLA